MTRRIAMWSGPRNISTALMRSWENRVDTMVLDEPLYAAYLARTGLGHPGRERILASQPTDWHAALGTLTAPCDTPVQYQKHMAHHVADDADLGWMRDLDHVFLIRHPARVVSSYVRRRAQVEPYELGFLQQVRLARHVREVLDRPLRVIHSEWVLRDPRAALTRLCAALDVPFDPAMLAWPAGPRDSDGIWAPHWYDAVRASTGFAPSVPVEADVDAAYAPVVDALMPAWEWLASIDPVGSPG